MKVNKIVDKKVNFKPYKITIEILVEDEYDMNLLSKLKGISSAVFLSDDDGNCISEYPVVNDNDADNANDLIQNILSNL